MKILIIARGVPNENYPLNGIFELDQAKALAGIGHDVVYFAIDLRSIRRKRKFGVSKQQIDSVQVYTISIPVGAIPLSIKIIIGQVALKRLYNNVFGSQNRPDVIHAHFTDMGCIASALSTEKNIPLVITEHSSIIGKNKVPKDILKIAVKGYSSAEKVIAVSGSLQRKIKEHTGIESTVVHNIIDEDVFLNSKRIVHDAFSFSSVGNLNKRKRMDLLIDAFGIVRKHIPNCRLEIIGDGKEREALFRQVDQLGIGDSVVFCGRLSRDEIAQHFATADCFVLPSELETFGVVYAEAMMAGLPVIASRCGGPEDFVTDEVGVLMDINTPQELANAMEQIFYNHDRFESEAIREYAVKHFSADVIAQKITCVYESILTEVSYG